MVEPRPRRRPRCSPSATWCSRSAGSGWRTRPDGPFGEQLRRGALPQPPLRASGDRLGARDRGLRPRGGAGLLPRALRARTTPSWWWPATSTRPRSSGSPRRTSGRSRRRPRSPPRARPQEPPPVAARRVEMRDARVREPYVAGSYLAPQRRPGDQARGGGADGAGGAPRRLGDHLGDGARAGARRRHRARRRRRLFRHRRRSAELRLYVVPKPGVGLAEAEARLDALIARFVAEGPGPGAARADQDADARRRDLRRSTASRAARAGSARRWPPGLTLEDVAAWPGLLQAVTPEDVQAAARGGLPPRGVGDRLADGPEQEAVGQ